mmetsp:Transcript_26253/g.37367  ORF Transcript_26253/g.37367 Transcript_26253/m.37367 type:complete len:2201 (+) Transcript_26253:1372-7974(+)
MFQNLKASDVKDAEIEGVSFSLMNDEIILQSSVLEIDTTMNTKKHIPTCGRINDPRLGTCSAEYACSTCGQLADDCPGHSAHIALPVPCFQAFIIPFAHKIMTCLCIRCGNLLCELDEAKMRKLEGIRYFRNRISELYPIALRNRICGGKKFKQSVVTGSSSSSDVPTHGESPTPGPEEGCGFKNPVYWIRSGYCLIRPVWEDHRRVEPAPAQADDKDSDAESKAESGAGATRRGKRKRPLASEKNPPSVSRTAKSCKTAKSASASQSATAPVITEVDMDVDVPVIDMFHIEAVLGMVSPSTCRIFGFCPEKSPLSSLVIRNQYVPPLLMRQGHGSMRENDLSTRLRNIQKAVEKLHLSLKQTPESSKEPSLRRGGSQTQEPGPEGVSAAGQAPADPLMAEAFEALGENFEGKFDLSMVLDRDSGQPRELYIHSLTHRAPEGETKTQKSARMEFTKDKQQLFAQNLNNFFRLQAQLAGFVDNRIVKPTDFEYGRTMQDVRSRFAQDKKSSKTGRVRKGLLGKRGGEAARAVAASSSEIMPDQVGVPIKICKILTRPETVRAFNYAQLLQLVQNGPDRYPGANFVTRDGQTFSLDRLVLEGGLQMGDVVHRHLLRGDYVAMNRQPTLTKYSLMAYRLVPHSGNTMKFHLAVTEAHNLDFDGDETNLFNSWDKLSIVEARELMAVGKNIFRNGSLSIPPVQHTVLAVYQLTLPAPEWAADATAAGRRKRDPSEGPVLDVDLLTRMLAPTNDSRFIAGTLQALRSRFGTASGRLPGREERFTGRQLVQVLIPTYCPETHGTLRKGALRSVLFRACTAGFWTNEDYIRNLGYLTFVCDEYLQIEGASLSLADCMTSFQLAQLSAPSGSGSAPNGSGSGSSSGSGTEAAFSRCYPPDVHRDVLEWESKAVELQDLMNKDGKDRDRDVCVCLDNARDRIAKYVQADLRARGTALFHITNSGAKGNSNHVVAFAGSIGQQVDAHSKRGYFLRTHVARDSVEQRGYVRDSFTSGMSGVEHSFHLASSRVGIIAQAVMTAETGYLERKTSEHLKDLSVCQDFSVRNAQKKIVLLNCGFSTDQLELVPMTTLDETEDEIWQRLGPPETSTELRTGAEVAWRQEDREWLLRDVRELLLTRRRVLTQNRIFRKTAVPLQFGDLVGVVREHSAAANGVPLSGSARSASVPAQTVYRQVRDLWRELTHGCHMIVTDELRLCFFENLAVRKLRQDVGVQNEGQLRAALGFVHRRLQQNVMEPGTAVGLISAHSVSAPLTQGELDRFHSAGQKSDVGNAVHAIRDLFGLSFKKGNTDKRFMEIYAQDDVRLDPKEFVQVLFSQIVRSWEVLEDVTGTRTETFEEFALVNGFGQVRGEPEIEEVLPASETAPFPSTGEEGSQGTSAPGVRTRVAKKDPAQTSAPTSPAAANRGYLKFWLDRDHMLSVGLSPVHLARTLIKRYLRTMCVQVDSNRSTSKPGGSKASASSKKRKTPASRGQKNRRQQPPSASTGKARQALLPGAKVPKKSPEPKRGRRAPEVRRSSRFRRTAALDRNAGLSDSAASTRPKRRKGASESEREATGLEDNGELSDREASGAEEVLEEEDEELEDEEPEGEDEDEGLGEEDEEEDLGEKDEEEELAEEELAEEEEEDEELGEEEEEEEVEEERGRVRKGRQVASGVRTRGTRASAVDEPLGEQPWETEMEDAPGVLQNKVSALEASVSFSSVSEPTWWLCINLDWLPLDPSYQKSSFLIQHVVHSVMGPNCLVWGIRGLVDFYTKEESVNFVDAEGRLRKRLRPVIVTRGSNLREVLLKPGVDTRYTRTNDVNEMYQEFGLDACAHAIEAELAKITNCDKNASVMRQHLHLIAAYMVHTGIPCALSFSGMHNANMSNLKKATFERIFESIVGAGVAGDEDPISGASEANTLGTRIPLGTGQDMKLLVDGQKAGETISFRDGSPAEFEYEQVNRIGCKVIRLENLTEDRAAEQRLRKDPVFRYPVTQPASEYWASFLPEECQSEHGKGPSAGGSASGLSPADPGNRSGLNPSARGRAKSVRTRAGAGTKTSGSSLQSTAGSETVSAYRRLKLRAREDHESETHAAVPVDAHPRKFARGTKKTQMSPIFAPGPDRCKKRSGSSANPLATVPDFCLGAGAETEGEGASSRRSITTPVLFEAVAADGFAASDLEPRMGTLRVPLQFGNVFVPTSPPPSTQGPAETS